MMNTRRFVLHLIVGLLAFLLGVTAAIALGGFNPLDRFDRHYSRQRYTIPAQPLSDLSTEPERYHGCPHARPRTADLRYSLDSSDTPAPAEPVAPFVDEDVPPPPPPPRAPRPRH